LHPVKTRIQETIEFANKLGFKRLGIAFCGGLRNEAGILSDILDDQGFEVASVICMVGRTPKEFLGIREDQKVSVGEFESMCSPITQAKVLNEVNTDFNIVFGLCVGHDSLFMRYSNALCTVLVTKDRVTGHNPLAALNLHSSYYRRLKKEKFGKGGRVKVIVEED
ncbi:MAG TPA: metal-binding protein, partial [Desulfobacteraceae bacterium]|nr:metal-binding protein [Desulfobacteraceae bacterium]